LTRSIEIEKGPVPLETALLFLDNVLNAGQVARNLKKKERKGKIFGPITQTKVNTDFMMHF
jgi:polysaccharide deacetylase 2 family uncharacterized protein YibQ